MTDRARLITHHTIWTKLMNCVTLMGFTHDETLAAQQGAALGVLVAAAYDLGVADAKRDQTVTANYLDKLH
jgi:hypothetical protein